MSFCVICISINKNQNEIRLDWALEAEENRIILFDWLYDDEMRIESSTMAI